MRIIFTQILIWKICRSANIEYIRISRSEMSSSSSLNTALVTDEGGRRVAIDSPSSSSSSLLIKKREEEEEEAGEEKEDEFWLSDILDSNDVFVDEVIPGDFVEFLIARKFPLKTLRKISESNSPHANHAKNTLFCGTHKYQLLAAIISDALTPDFAPPDRSATSQESITRNFCGFTCEAVYEDDDDEEDEKDDRKSK